MRGSAGVLLTLGATGPTRTPGLALVSTVSIVLGLILWRIADKREHG